MDFAQGLLEPGGKFTEGLTVFAPKDGNLHSRMEINWLNFGNTALETDVCASFLSIHGKIVRLMLASDHDKKGEMRANELGDPESVPNRSRSFLCGLTMVSRKTRYLI